MGASDGPTSGHTGGNVFGYNLSGDCTRFMTPTYLTTTAIACRNYSFVQLRFGRWLGVEAAPSDKAAIEASNGGAWTPVWSKSASDIADTEWASLTYDISAVADGEPTAYIRWQLGPTDGGITYPGWNIDDVGIWGATTAATVDGDLNGDGDVDIACLSALLGIYGLCDGQPGYDAAADYDASGCIDLPDLWTLLANYGVGT